MNLNFSLDLRVFEKLAHRGFHINSLFPFIHLLFIYLRFSPESFKSFIRVQVHNIQAKLRWFGWIWKAWKNTGTGIKCSMFWHFTVLLKKLNVFMFFFLYCQVPWLFCYAFLIAYFSKVSLPKSKNLLVIYSFKSLICTWDAFCE